MRRTENSLVRLVEKNNRKRILRRALSVLCAITVLLTTNTLKFDADTLEHLPTCGLVEHVHDETCLDEAGEYACGLEEHLHTDACYQERPLATDEDEEELPEEVELEPEAEEAPFVETEPEDDEVKVLSVDDEPEAGEMTEVMLGEEDDGEDASTIEDAQEDSAEEPVYSLLDRDYITLSEMSLPLQAEAVISVLEVVPEDGEGAFVPALCVEQVDLDYIIMPIADFAEREIAIETAEGITLVKLTDGAAIGEAETEQELTDAEDGQAGEEPVEDGQAEEEPAEEEPAEEEPVEYEQVEEEPVVEEPVEDEQAEEEPVVEEPVEDEQAEEEPVVEEPVEEEPVEDEQTEEEPVEDGQAEEESVVEELVVEEPVEEEPVVEEPVVEEPVEEEQVEEEPVEDEQPEAVTAPAQSVARYSVTVDLAEVAEYPLSLKAVMASAIEEEPAEEAEAPVIEEEPAEEAETSDVEEEPAEEAAPEIEDDIPEAVNAVVVEAETSEADAQLGGGDAAPEAQSDVGWRIEFDDALLSVEYTDEDYAITPVADFDRTVLTVDNGAVYTITLLNGSVGALYPAQDFAAATDSVSVSVSAPEGAFPEGTTLSVMDVVDETTIDDIMGTVTEGFVEVERVHAVDISFRDAEGVEIEPRVPISVVMTPIERIDEDRETVVVHVDDVGEVQRVETADDVEPDAPAEADEIAVDEDSGVAFVADAFSVYALVVTKKLDTKVIASDGETYSIEVTYTEDAGIPDGAVLAVTEVTGDGSYLAEVEKGLAGNKLVTLARFFDIKIMESDAEDAGEVQPLEPVEVKIWLTEPEDAAENDAVDATVTDADDHIITVGAPAPAAMHFPEESAVDTLPAAEDEDAVVFTAEGFSVWGVVYTVDFYYGNYEYHLDGGESMTLSALFDALEIEADAADAVDVTFSDDALIQVEKIENDWTLTSLAPFDTEETLTVTMADGTVYVVRVEDDINSATEYLTFKIINPEYGVVYASTGGVDYAIEAKTYAATTTVKKAPDGSETANTYAPINTKGKTANSWKTSTLNGGVFVGLIADRAFKLDGTNIEANTLVPSIKGMEFDISEPITITNLTAIFRAKNDRIIYYVTDGNGTVSQDGQTWGYTSDPYGATATPNSGYVFDHWEYGDSQTYSEKTFDPWLVSEDSVVKACFKQATETVTITYKTTLNNSFVYFKNAARSANSPITESIVEGSIPTGAITYTTASDRRHFVAWVDSQGHYLTDSETLTINEPVTNDIEYIAVYVNGSGDSLLAYTNIPEAGAWRTYSANYSGNAPYMWASQLTLPTEVTFRIEPNYELDNFIYNGEVKEVSEVSTVNGQVYTIKDYVNNNHNSGVNILIANVHPKDSAVIKYNSSNTTQGTVSTAVEYVADNATAKGSQATAIGSNYFAFWTDGDGVVVSRDAYYRPKTVTADATYTANFYGNNQGKIVFYPTDPSKTLTEVGYSLFTSTHSIVQTATGNFAGNNYDEIKVDDATNFKYWEVEGEYYSLGTSVKISEIQPKLDTGKSPKLYFVRAVYSSNTSKVVGYQSAGNGSVTNDVDLLSSIHGSTAVPDDGYVFDHWEQKNAAGEIINPSFSTKTRLTAADLTEVEEDCVLVAVFRAEKAYHIRYYADYSEIWLGQLTEGNHCFIDEDVSEGGTPSGATAEKQFKAEDNVTRYFVGWWDALSGGKVVSTNEKFVPTIDMLTPGETVINYFFARFSVYPYIVPTVNEKDWGTVTHQNDAVGLSNLVGSIYTLNEDIIAKPNEGFKFAHWEYYDNNGTLRKKDGDTLAKGIWVGGFDGIMEVKAVFVPEDSVKVTYTAADGGSVSNDVDYISGILAAKGSTATPPSGKEFKGWYIGDELFSTDQTLTSADINLGTVKKDTTLTAKFGEQGTTENAYKFTTIVNQEDRSKGTIDSGGYTGENERESENGRVFKITGSGRVIDNSANYRFSNGITTKADSGYRFAFWLDDNGKYYTSISNSTVIYENNLTYTAYFAPTSANRIVYMKEGNGKLNNGTADRLTGLSTDTNKVTAYADSGYTFAGWYDQDGELISTQATFDPALATRDMAVTARFITTPDAYGDSATFGIRLADANGNMTKVQKGATIRQNDGSYKSEDTFRTLRNNGIIRNENLPDENKASDGITDVLTKPESGYYFLYWALERDGVISTLNHDSRNILTADTGDGKELYLIKGDKLYAVYSKLEPVYADESQSAAQDAKFNDERREQLREWMSKIDKNLRLFGTDKTAAVSLSEEINNAYGNRVYQIDITAEASKSALTSAMDMAFVLDASNSMKFPAKISLLEPNETLVLTQANLNDAFPNDNGPYFIISDPAGTSTMYRIFKKSDGIWYYVDAAYPDSDGKPVTWDLPYAERSGNPPYAYPIYKAENYQADPPKGRRLDDLNTSMEKTIQGIKDIVKATEGDPKKVRIAYNTFAASILSHNNFRPSDEVSSIEVIKQAGGTRQDYGLEDALNFDWTADYGQRYVILITDGASVVSKTTDDYENGYGLGADPLSIRANVRRTAERIKREAGVTLITIGLSTKNVEGGSNLLKDIADPNPKNTKEKLFFGAESSDDLEYIMLEILQTIMSKATIAGEVTDTVDPVFYPVKADGTPVETGYYNTEGIKLSAAPTDGSAYYEWKKVTKSVNSTNCECWQVTWYNYPIGLKTDSNEFHETFYVKAKEDFLGGNAMPTNVGEAVVKADKHKFPSDTEWRTDEEKNAELPTPYVNVDELALTQNDTVWTVYLGENVDPVAQLKALFKQIDVLKVVSGDTDNMITSKNQMLGGKTASSATFNLYDMIGSGSNSDAGDKIASADADENFKRWAEFLFGGSNGNSKTLSIRYHPYGHYEVGRIQVSLEKTIAEGETGITGTYDANGTSTINSNHATTVTGEPVETYKLTVKYVPGELGNASKKRKETGNDELSVSNWHTNADGNPGAATDEMESVNTHTINVFAKKLQIAKKNADFTAPLEGAEFVLVRTARAGENEDYTIGEAKYHKVQTLEESTGGIHTSGWVAKLNSGEKYYLIETKAPAGYTALSAPVEVTLSIVNTYPPETAENPNPIPNMPYNWTQKASLALDSVALVSRRNEAGDDISKTGITKDSTSETVYYWIANNPGYELPSTGGAGTAAYTVSGLGLIALALFLLCRRRRGY